MRRLAWILVAILLAGPAAALCVGDCDGDGQVRVNELVVGVGIVLSGSSAAECPAADPNGDGEVTIAELIAAVNSLLSGCPIASTPSPMATDTAPPIDTPTPSPTVPSNQPPTLPSPFVYRGYVGQAIALPLGAVDPDGGAVSCAADALLAGMTLGADNVLRWIPADDQLGPLTVPVRCEDDGTPPLAVAGSAAFRIAPQDPCVTPVCDPATGCTGTVAPLIHACCDNVELPHLPEAE
ncbi:MAG: hypothetical protein U1E73_14835, partial [Planctomycetota bacterium]